MTFVVIFREVFGCCLFKEAYAEDTVMSPRPCLWALEFSFSPGQPRPRLPVGPGLARARSWSGAVWPECLPLQPAALQNSLGTMNTQIPMLLPRHSQVARLLREYFLSLFSSTP